nr:unnamed protein product [Callosobruchus analis]
MTGTNSQGYMYLWTEDKAKRGADEVAYVLLKFLASKTDTEDLIIFIDNRPGQNKNWLLTSLWLQLVKEKRFKTITHHFLVNGHTHLPSDRDFALIEKRHRKYAPEIYAPEGWYEVIRKSNSKTPFNVTIMNVEVFYDFQPILSNIAKRTKTDDGAILDFSKVFSFQSNRIFVKHSVNGEYKEVNLRKKGSQIKRKYNESLPIAKRKVENVISLMKYIQPVHHLFYTDLK